MCAGSGEREKKGSISEKQLQDEANQPAATIKRHVQVMCSQGAIQEADGGWQVVDGVALEDVARLRGTVGASASVYADVGRLRKDQTTQLQARPQKRRGA